MVTKIKIIAGVIEIIGELDDTEIAKSVIEALPFEEEGELWGDEIYFHIPVKVGMIEENSTELLQLGDIAYWPAGACFCIFFGKTPLSSEGEIRAAGPVNVIGRLTEEPQRLKGYMGGIVKVSLV
ncbi:cyclophilin-like fold protein [Elusimicrobiota bacterium]